MSHRALVHEYLSCIVALDLAAEDNPLHVMPLYHSAQMHVFLVPWLAVGATNTILEVPGRCRGPPADRAGRPPRLLRSADALGRDGQPRRLRDARPGRSRQGLLRRLDHAGAGAQADPAKAPSLGFYNCFGQSEVAPLATVLRPEEHADRPDSAGRPILFVEARVIDRDGNDVAAGETGEIVYRSPQLCDGYWNDPKATDEAFAGGWFHSGDLVRIDEEGFIFVVDRIKDVINTGGVLVASREVEDALYTHPAVAEVAVVG